MLTTSNDDDNDERDRDRDRDRETETERQREAAAGRQVKISGLDGLGLPVLCADIHFGVI